MRAWLLVLVGCSELIGDSSVDKTPVCKAGDPRVDAEVFAALTANRWGYCGSNNGLCLTLSATGDYTTVAGFDDYSIEDAGRWNFLARDATSGLVCFDDGSITDFAITPDGLQWRTDGLLPRLDAIAGFGSRDALDTFAAPDLFATLTHNACQRQNELNLFYLPTSFTIRRNGTWDAVWRYGECRANGTVSIVNAPTQLGVSQQELWAYANPNVCDKRNGGIPASIPDVDEYAEHTGDHQFLSFASYGEGYGLRVRASWQSALRGGQQKEWTLSLANQSARTQTVQSIQIAMTPVAPTTDGYTATGPTVMLVDQAVGQDVAPHGTIEARATLALPAAGEYSMSIAVGSADERQPYQNRAGYVALIRP